MNERQRWLLIGIAIGAAAAALLRDAFKPFVAAVRPLAKAMLKAGVIAGERARERAAELGETIEDLIVEVQAERRFEAMAGVEDVPDFAPAPDFERPEPLPGHDS
jgi:hypothetical protein